MYVHHLHLLLEYYILLVSQEKHTSGEAEKREPGVGAINY